MEPSEVDVERSVPRHPDNVTFTDLDSPHDGNKCQLLRLPNGIEVILASDPAMQLSAVALIVCAGWLDDPADCNGIAHLAEHCVARCIFDTGVAQPGQSEQTFEQLISQNGGCSSALVTSDYTMYAFAVAPAVFKYALDSFADIFKSPPSLSYETVGHEALAVDAEFQKDRQIHAECIRNLNTYLARPESREYRCLEGGNYESLTDHVEDQRKAICPIDSHDPGDAAVWESLRVRLLDWCEANYPTRQKYVSICGPESLEELAERALESVSSIPNPSSPIGRIYSDKFHSPWADSHKDIVIFCTTPQALWTVDLCWVIPWSGTARDETSIAVLRYILTDSDVNSVFARLHRRRWFETLQVYSEAGDMQDGYHYLRIRINLTELGWQNWRSVVHLVQSYLTLIRNEPPSQDVIDDALQVGRNSALHNECNPPVLAKVLVEKLWRVYPKNALFSSDFHHTVDSFHEWLTKYLDPRDVRVILSGPSGWAKASVAEEDWEILPRLGIKYRVARLAEYRNSSHEQDTGSHELCLPKRNPFVPYTLAMHDLSEMEDLPSVDLIIRSESLLAYRQVVDIQDPRAYIVVVLDSPLFNTVEHQLSFQVYGRIVMERLKSTLNRATIAGTWPNLSVGTESVTMQVSGYPAYLIELLKTMWDAFFDLEAQVEPWEFDEQRDQVLRRLESEMHSCFGGLGLNIGDGSRAELRSLLSKRQFRPQTLAAAMQDVSLASVRECMENITRNGYNVKMGLVGNLNASIIRSAMDLCMDGAKTPLKPEEWFDLPSGNFILEVVEPRPTQRPNQIYYFCRVAKDENYKLDLTARLIRYFVVSTLFAELHSRYDIGHDFSATIHNGGGYLWLIIEGRTPRDPAYVERCIDQFLEDLLRTFENTPADDFVSILQNLEETRGDECRSSFEQESTAMMNYVLYQTDIAVKTGEPVSHMPHTEVSLQDIVDLFRSTVSPRSIYRSKISMRLYSSPRCMSAPAIHNVFDEISSRGIPVAFDLENKLLARLPFPMDSFIDAIQHELDDQMGLINIKHIVRIAAEKYPLEDGEKGSASEELASVPAAPLIYVESVDEFRAEINQRSRTTLGVERCTRVACHYRL